MLSPRNFKVGSYTRSHYQKPKRMSIAAPRGSSWGGLAITTYFHVWNRTDGTSVKPMKHAYATSQTLEASLVGFRGLGEFPKPLKHALGIRSQNIVEECQQGLVLHNLDGSSPMILNCRWCPVRTQLMPEIQKPRKGCEKRRNLQSKLTGRQAVSFDNTQCEIVRLKRQCSRQQSKFEHTLHFRRGRLCTGARSNCCNRCVMDTVPCRC